ncbi:MAG: hypothetical protein COB36_02145 [Alphaproteobacteria bacterium]|nr:MAG: hypothetical protein COB36_02145 [Alphaproteobacteria bacterium]
MFTQVVLPWWGWGYLLVVLTIFVTSFFSEKSLNMNEVSASAMSLFSICVFVIGFYNPLVVQFLGILIIPMTLIGIYWEFTSAIYETGNAQDELAREADLSDGERTLLLNVAIGFNALIVVPGYVLGIILSIYVLGIV